MTKATQTTGTLLALSLACGLTLAGTANASRSSSDSEMRGFQTCVAGARAEAGSITPTRHYLLDRGKSTNEFFINGYQWQDGERVAMKVACLTSMSGRRLVSVEMSEGRFVARSEGKLVDVATN